MGEVYRARDSRLDRTVAIKILPASFSSEPGRLERFAQEARAAAALNHPNILSIFDIGDQQGAPFVVSELLEGETLRDVLRNGPLPIRKAVDYSLQIARGLTAAHNKGIVHRDLKPENIFVTNDGRVKILDFGLAKLLHPEASGGDTATVQGLTNSGVVLGTVGYMSPEQVRGKPTDPRSDLFSFGSILFEMLSAKRAFHGDSPADTMSAILKEEPPELSETGRNIPLGLERIVRHCLEKNPAQRFQSAGDLAFDLEALTDISATGKSETQIPVVARSSETPARSRWPWFASALALFAAAVGFSWWLGNRTGYSPPPEYQQITFRTGSIGNARFTPDGSIVYSAAWQGAEPQLYIARADDNGARALGFKGAELLAISRKGELALRLNSVFMGGYARAGTLARVPLSGGTPRQVLDHVQDADWAADGESMAVVRWDPQKTHWRLEYPVGKILLDGPNWLSDPKISPDGKWIAFSDHQNTDGDDRGTVAVVGQDGKERVLSTGWSSVEGVLWSPDGSEVWFTASRAGSSDNLYGITLSGKQRNVANVPGGMWLQDLQNGTSLVISHQQRIAIRGVQPGGTEEHELGWLGWSILRDISADGTKIVFDEEADGGGPNYTAFMRDTDGSPPVRISDGVALAISPDNQWVITQAAQGGPLHLVPTGAGESRQLTHDNVNYSSVRYFADGKRILGIGIEPGHAGRDYVIDAATGGSRPITAEGFFGVELSPDEQRIAVFQSNGKLGIWAIGDSTAHEIPNCPANYNPSGWTADGSSIYVLSSQVRSGPAKVYRLNVTTGQMEYWQAFGTDLPSGLANVGGPLFFSRDKRAYAYVYSQILSQAYVVRGLK
jgi:serine/threonine protein kinase/Tol biopolymer transport system component